MHLLPPPGPAQRSQTASGAEAPLRRTVSRDRTAKHTRGLLTYLPLRNSLLPASVIISKAAEAAFYGDPCFSGQFRGALFIALQPARNAPQQRRTTCLDGAEAVWAISAGRAALAALFDNSGGGFVSAIDSGRAQSSGPRCRGARRADLSRNSGLKISARRCFHFSRKRKRAGEPP